MMSAANPCIVVVSKNRNVESNTATVPFVASRFRIHTLFSTDSKQWKDTPRRIPVSFTKIAT